MKERTVCKIEGCTNMVKAKGRNENGEQTFSHTCRNHKSNGEPKYRNRGKATTNASRLRFGKPIRKKLTN